MKVGLYYHHALSFTCVPPSFQLLNHLTDFHETWYGRSAVESHHNALLLICHNVMCQTREVVRLNRY